jgi:hypothetical protein
VVVDVGASVVELPSVGRYGCSPVSVSVDVAVPVVDVEVLVVVVDVTVLVVGDGDEGLSVTTVVSAVEDDAPGSSVVTVAVMVMAVTVLATQPICAHLKPAMQHPPPNSAWHAVLPFPQSPTLPPQVCPSGQHPTFPEFGEFSTT